MTRKWVYHRIKGAWELRLSGTLEELLEVAGLPEADEPTSRVRRWDLLRKYRIAHGNISEVSRLSGVCRQKLSDDGFKTRFGKGKRLSMAILLLLILPLSALSQVPGSPTIPSKLRFLLDNPWICMNADTTSAGIGQHCTDPEVPGDEVFLFRTDSTRYDVLEARIGGEVWLPMGTPLGPLRQVPSFVLLIPDSTLADYGEYRAVFEDYHTMWAIRRALGLTQTRLP